MPTPHYTYSPSLDPELLMQGDVLRRHRDLLRLLKRYFPYYHKNTSYRYFMVTTQSCDLVRRDGKPPRAPYVTIAPARPLAEVLLRKAYDGQTSWQSDTLTIGTSVFDELQLFLIRLIDNNEPEYFYLHPEPDYGIDEPCCVSLQLGVSLRRVHYKAFLDSKIAQLDDNFQSKLGWLIGSTYSQVGTVEWNQKYESPDCSQLASKYIKDQFKVIDDKQIVEGLRYIEERRARDGAKSDLTSAEIFNRINRFSVKPGATKFRERAQELLTVNKGRVFDPIASRALAAIKVDASIKESVARILGEKNVEKHDEVASDILRLIIDKLKPHLSDADMDPSGRLKSIKGLVSLIAEDDIIRSLLG